ncbi:hypothetical protein WG904_04770 [Pedobacter sp. Du54]|uniref:hypothetical protein n=1 Tax=Pedobacter anseongensis TaxID=3133439 RepID=UPI0030A9F0B0
MIRANSSFKRLLIYKTKSKNFHQLQLTYVPDYDYLQQNHFDASRTQINKLDNFSGYIEYSSVKDEKPIFILRFEKGKFINKYYIGEKNAKTGKGTLKIAGIEVGVKGWDLVCTPVYGQVCVLHGDPEVETCGSMEVVREDCEQVYTPDPDPEPDPEPVIDCDDHQNFWLCDPENPETPDPEDPPVPVEYQCDDCSCVPETEMVDADAALEPKWGQLGNLTSIKNEVNKLIGQTQNFNFLNFKDRLTSLKNYFNANRMYTRDANNNLIDAPGSAFVDRYIYTENNGWIDMHHFFYAAALTEEYSPAYAYSYTASGELIQSMLNSQTASAFSYEDMPSNAAGIEFWKAYGQSLKNGTADFNSAIHNFFNQLNPKDPSDAPNFEYIPHIIDGLAPKNKSTTGLTGATLRNEAKASFCKKSANSQKNIIEAHTKLPHSSH